MDHLVVVIFLAVLAWLTIPALLFWTLFLVTWLILKSENHALISQRYAILRLLSPLRGLWISMSVFMQERAFLKLDNRALKSVLKFMYPLYNVWDRTLMFSIALFLLLVAGLCLV